MFAATNMMFTGRAFNPLSLSPALWLDSSDASTLYSGASPAAADGAISEWRDKSGNARHVTQATGVSQPLRKTAVQNGRDVVRFDGSNDFLLLTDWHQSAITVFAVYQPANNANLQHVVRKGSAANVSLEFLMRATSATTASFGASSTTVVVNTQTKPTGGAWYLHIGRYGGSAVESWINDSAVTSQAHSGNILNGTTQGAVGALRDDSGNTFNHLQGDLAELLIFPTAVSDANRLVVQQYLNAKWGIY